MISIWPLPKSKLQKDQDKLRILKKKSKPIYNSFVHENCVPYFSPTLKNWPRQLKLCCVCMIKSSWYFWFRCSEWSPWRGACIGWSWPLIVDQLLGRLRIYIFIIILINISKIIVFSCAHNFCILHIILDVLGFFIFGCAELWIFWLFLLSWRSWWTMLRW